MREGQYTDFMISEEKYSIKEDFSKGQWLSRQESNDLLVISCTSTNRGALRILAKGRHVLQRHFRNRSVLHQGTNLFSQTMFSTTNFS